MITRTRDRKPTTPGEILRYEFLEPLRMSQTTLAKLIKVDVKTINRVVNGRTRVTPELAVELGRVLNTTPQFWLNAQNAVDVYEVQTKKNQQATQPTATEVDVA